MQLQLGKLGWIRGFEMYLQFTVFFYVATGSRTTLYNVQDTGDPNDSIEGDEMETQYLIKWKNWAHFHNTWESEQTLKDQHVNGLKRLENFCKKQMELQEW